MPCFFLLTSYFMSKITPNRRKLHPFRGPDAAIKQVHPYDYHRIPTTAGSFRRSSTEIRGQSIRAKTGSCTAEAAYMLR